MSCRSQHPNAYLAPPAAVAPAAFAAPQPPPPGALEDLGAQLAATHTMIDVLTAKLARVLKPVPDDDIRADRDAPCSNGPIAHRDFTLREMVAGGNRAANRLAALVERIDL